MTDSTNERPQPRHSHSKPYSLPADSYTAYRLQHATPQHLHQTSQRCFIGPIPEGWLKSHRKDWYKNQFHINYSSRTASFDTTSPHGKHRRLSGHSRPSAIAMFGSSFPQPNDLEVDNDLQVDGQGASRSATITRSPSGNIPRSESPDVIDVTEAIEDPPEEEIPVRPEFRNMRTASSRVKTLKEISKSRSRTDDSFVTASEGSSDDLTPGITIAEANAQDDDNVGAKAHGLPTSVPDSPELGPSSTSELNPPKNSSVSATSTSQLINDQNATANAGPSTGLGGQKKESEVKGILARARGRLHSKSDTAETDESKELKRKRSSLRALVQFEIPEDSKRAEIQMKARAAQISIQRASTRLRRTRAKDGQIVKMDRMLVRVDITGHELPDFFDENEIQKVEARTTEKWREYMVVCRQSTGDDDAEHVLQMYDSRVIPAIEETRSPKRTKHQIMLGRNVSKVNLFSSLDKTVVLWTPCSKGTMIYIMQARSSSDAVEWYTFLRTLLGWSRAEEVQVNVPDMSVSLMLQNPFENLECSQDAVQAAEGDDEALVRTMKEEQAVAGNIVTRSLAMLKKNPEWDSIMKAWEHERIGLCWKRYDRLEWIHGENERRMYGTIAMMKSHDLELRPKEHYPTVIRRPGDKTTTDEPPPVEGFLVRLTSQRGASKRLGKLFFKRLYYSTYNQFLVFSTPAHAHPPPPPRLPPSGEAEVPPTREVAESIPLTFSVDPYPLAGEEIEWLAEGHSSTSEQRRMYDLAARDEADRKLTFLNHCQGFVNLCDVSRVRNFKMGATPADEGIDDEGSDVEFDGEVRDTTRHDGSTRSVDDSRTFEMVMKNGLVVRFQSFDEETKKEWIRRLRALIKYWKRRVAEDVQLLKIIRHQNLEELKIDEETEAFVGQFARKWEVSHSFASPELYNMCGISCCRTIHLSGTLYRKPRRHATFARCSVILCNGRLLIFQDTIRRRSGRIIPSSHQERMTSLELKDCYSYSGLLTESDLLYQNQTFDSNKPGHHALPRIYLEDGWTSTDEDVMTCFVIWHGKKKSWFRSPKGDSNVDEGRRKKLKLVSRLGVPGRSIVFRARSRAERDHWVLAVQNEIERLKEEEDFRIEEKRSG